MDSARIEILAQGEILRAITKDAARNLHGSLQSKLTACILALDRAAQANDLDAHAHAVARAREILSQPWSAPMHETENSDIDSLVKDKVAMWQGLAGITAYVDPGLHDLRGPIVQRVGEIVEEGVCNAVRHGEADTVSVQVEHVVEVGVRFVRIRVLDDGTGPGEWTAGLGTTFVDEACAGRWSRGRPTRCLGTRGYPEAVIGRRAVSRVALAPRLERFQSLRATAMLRYSRQRLRQPLVYGGNYGQGPGRGGD